MIRRALLAAVLLGFIAYLMMATTIPLGIVLFLAAVGGIIVSLADHEQGGPQHERAPR